MTAAAWDCHAHIFAPYADYPLSADRSYTPPEAPLADYLALLAALRLEHGVIVHPSAYGNDFSLLFDTLRACPRLRGVIVLRAHSLSALRLGDLHEKGVRAARFSHRSGAAANFAGSASLVDMLALGPRLADAGLHAELWTDTRSLPDIESALRAYPTSVVIDHMGGFDVDEGIDSPGFRSLLSLVESGDASVKLCAYRSLVSAGDFERGRPFHDALVRANPQQLVWGSDWPHLRVVPSPDTARLLDTFKRWTADEALIEQMMVSNPSKLYM